MIPVHGEYRHLMAHAELARVMGVDPAKVIVAEDGDVVRVDDKGVTSVGRVSAEYVFVHGVGDVSGGTLADRVVLGNEGMVTAMVCVDIGSRHLLAGPVIATRGWAASDETDGLIEAMSERIRVAVEEALAEKKVDVRKIEKVVRRAAGSFVAEQTRRRPMIVPVVAEA
jgi:ribonuclease J